MDKIEEAQERAEHLLGHYLSTVFRAAGLSWNSDSYAEVGAIVDAIADMVRAGVEEHRTADHVYPDGSTG